MNEFLRIYINEILLTLVGIMGILVCFIIWIDQKEEQIKETWAKKYAKGELNG
jgi:hypothetical protein